MTRRVVVMKKETGDGRFKVWRVEKEGKKVCSVVGGLCCSHTTPFSTLWLFV